MTADDVGLLKLADATVLYLTGITPALSPGCAALVDVAIELARANGTHVVFDVNSRPSLWPGRDAPTELLSIAARCDTVLIGLDEAAALWDTRTPQDVRRLLPNRHSTLVVKDGPVGATEFEAETETFVPIERLEIIEPVGAGDAFAAGYLDRRLHGQPSRARLLGGHRHAAMALRSIDDIPVERVR